MANKRLDTIVTEAVEAAMKETCRKLDTRFREEIESTEWSYPTEPRVRDIVSTGRLRDSQTMTVAADGSVTFSWPVPYAAQVHEGGVTTDGERFPGRPWTRDPLNEFERNFTDALDRELDQRLPRARGGGS